MATVTITAVASAPMQAKYGPNRNWNVQQSYVTTATLSTQDVVLFSDLKIPHGAVITDIVFKGAAPDGAQYTYEMGALGSGGSIDVFGSVTISVTQVNKVVATGLPYTVSVSDDANLRYQTIAIRADGAPTSATASVSMNINVKYYTR